MWLEKIEDLHEELTSEQNLAIKQLYLIIRDILFDLKQQIIQKGYKFGDVSSLIKFCGDFRKEYKPAKNTKGWKQQGCGIEVEIPDNIKKDLPNLATPFYLSFPFEESELGGMVYNGWGENKGKTDEMRINLYHLMNDFDKYKFTIQHELQHITDEGSAPDESEGNFLIKTKDYICHKGEIAAFAKEGALRYYKMFPQDDALDFDKFKQNFYKKAAGSVNINNYINFGEDLIRLKNQYNLNQQQIEELIACYNFFKSTLIRSFLYFKKISNH